MNGWQPPGPTCPSCLQSHVEIQTVPCTKMITSTTLNTPLKKPSNGQNGLVKNGHHPYTKLDTIKNHNRQKKGFNANGHLQLMKDCCFKSTVSTKSIDSEAETLEEDEDNSCGLWSFRPRWLQKFANKKAFLAVFCLTSVLQGMYYTYFVSVLTTIEKLFQIQSKYTGIIMSATEMGQIFGALLLTYYGGQGHRPKWIAYGMLVFAFAAILCAAPHFMFKDTMTPTRRVAESEENLTLNNLRDLRTKLCFLPFPAAAGLSRDSVLSTTSIYSPYNSSTFPPVPHMVVNDAFQQNYQMKSHDSLSELFLLSNDSLSEGSPRHDALIDQQAKCEKRKQAGIQKSITEWVLSIFFISLLFIGVGATAVYTLGIPYIDDNVATRESPLYFGITIGVRIFGPVFGFVLGSYCTSIYVNFPFEKTDLTPDDPQWIGAWWLGVFIVGAALIITTIPMMAFPKKLPHPYENHHRHNGQHLIQAKICAPEQSNGNSNGTVCKSHQCHPSTFFNGHTVKSPRKKPSLRDFPSAIWRLTGNKMLMFRTASSVLHILPIAGLYTFLPKYLESQFQLTATKANMISGMAGILVMGVGIFASGSFMRKFKPNARFVAGWIALAALAYSFGMVILMWLGCPLNSYVGLNSGSIGDVPGHSSCKDTCGCRPGEFAPICTSDNVTYLSPCLAGCTVVTGSTKDHFVYKDCHCLQPNVTAVNGFCPLQCNNLVWYILIFSMFVLIHSTSEVGSMLLTLRCVEPQDKAMALGLISFAIGLFGNVPCPIIYGAVVDSACLFWEDNCGGRGACRLYDPSKFRTVFHGVTAVIMLAAFIVDVVVWYLAKDVKFTEDDEDEVLANGEEILPFNPAQNNSKFESSV